MNHPLLLLLLTAGGVYVAMLWRNDLRATQEGRAIPGALPGATPATRRAILIGVGGALGILVLETAGEIALGLVDEQSRMTWLFALYSVVAAPVIEELIFRGWLVVENRGRAAMWAGAFAASLLFAVLHPFLWKWEDAGFQFTLTRKGTFSTGIVFLASLWFYAARLGPWNPQRSLLPCFTAHAAKNAGVVAVKAAAGFVGPLW